MSSASLAVKGPSPSSGDSRPDSVFIADKSHTPKSLAQMLQQLGLKSVGVLKFQSCLVGRGQFLVQLKHELHLRGIQVGYLSGYTGVLLDPRFIVDLCGRKFRLDSNIGLKLLFPPAWPTLFGKGKSVWGIFPPSWCQKVVKGDAHVRFAGTRYDLPSEFLID